MVAASRQHKWINLFAQRGQRSNRPAWLRSSPGDAFSCWGDRRGYAVSGKNFSSSLSLAPRARFEAASTVTRSHLPLGTKCLQGETRGEVAVALSCRNDHARTLCRKEDSEKAEQHRLRDWGIGVVLIAAVFELAGWAKEGDLCLGQLYDGIETIQVSLSLLNAGVHFSLGVTGGRRCSCFICKRALFNFASAIFPSRCASSALVRVYWASGSDLSAVYDRRPDTIPPQEHNEKRTKASRQKRTGIQEDSRPSGNGLNDRWVFTF